MKSNYADYYYNFLIGEYPNDEDYRSTALIFEYLKDANVNEIDIYKVIESMQIIHKLSFNDIPDYLWDKSILTKGVFYYHKELQIVSKPPTWEITYPHYLEMKIMYTLEDALNYFIERSNVRSEWINRDKEIGSIKFLLKDYIKFKFMEPLDFFLHLIDYSVSSKIELNSIYDLRHEEIALAKHLEIDLANAVAMGKNIVKWRS